MRATSFGQKLSTKWGSRHFSSTAFRDAGSSAHPPTRRVQIDLDPARIGLRYPVEVGLVGDSSRALRALLPQVKRNEDRSFLGRAQNETKEWWKLMEERGSRQERPMKPQVVAWELGKRLSDSAIVSSDSGTIATWFARQIPARRGQMFSLSGTLATMANGLALCDSRSDRTPGSAMHCVRR